MICYNCEDSGRVSIKGIPICPDCQQPVTKEKDCGCGSRDDLLGQFLIVECPVCKGHRQGDLFR